MSLFRHPATRLVLAGSLLLVVVVALTSAIAERAAEKEALADALSHALVLRHTDNATYRQILRDLGSPRADDPARWGSVLDELRAGRITELSSATGLGQLLLDNVERYYPKGRAGIGDPVQEAAGMLRYIEASYGNPEVAWGNHSANPRRHHLAAR